VVRRKISPLIFLAKEHQQHSIYATRRSLVGAEQIVASAILILQSDNIIDVLLLVKDYTPAIFFIHRIQY
jgi:hypothetical protein